MTNTAMRDHTTVVRTSRGLSIAGTRITLAPDGGNDECDPFR